MDTELEQAMLGDAGLALEALNDSSGSCEEVWESLASLLLSYQNGAASVPPPNLVSPCSLPSPALSRYARLSLQSGCLPHP